MVKNTNLCLFFTCIVFISITIIYYFITTNSLIHSAKYVNIFKPASDTQNAEVSESLIEKLREPTLIIQTTTVVPSTTTTTTASTVISTTTRTTTTTSTTTSAKTNNTTDADISGLTFDEIIREYCPVEINQIGYDCLKKLSKVKLEPEKYNTEVPIIYYHTFWRLGEGKPHHLRVMLLQIFSFLATQDLTKGRFIIWLQEDFPANVKEILDKKFSYYLNNSIVQIRILDLPNLCSKDSFKKYYDSCVNAHKGNSVAYSDFVRFLILYNYGGIYTDGDVFYLRDMRPFWKKDFVHRWSFTHDYNTAIMGLQLNRSQSVETFYNSVLNSGATHVDLVHAFYPAQVKDRIAGLNRGQIYNYTGFNVYHSIIFDPAWLCNDGILPRLDDKIVCVFREFYDTIINSTEFNIKKFYDGAFTFHLHLGNCGSCTIGPTSFFYHIENYFVSKIPNLGNS